MVIRWMVKKETGLCVSELDEAAKEGDLTPRAMCNLKTGFWFEFGRGEDPGRLCCCGQSVPRSLRFEPIYSLLVCGWSGVLYFHYKFYYCSTFQLSTFPPKCNGPESRLISMGSLQRNGLHGHGSNYLWGCG